MPHGWSAARVARTLAALAAAGSSGPPAQVDASWIESLVMPGDVIAKHASLEHQCDKCHARFDKTAQDRLCLACHIDVAADFEATRGYHGQAPSTRDRPCRVCHAEHLGRGATMVRLDRTTFDHGLTDLALHGRHLLVPCDDCHAPGTRYREAPSDCSTCHARDDPHDGCLGMACDGCHRETAWPDVRFDHGTTAFPLEGRHRETLCTGCHATKRYKPAPTSCHDCHAADDKHRGTLGRTCESCHTAQTWSSPRFDHSRETTFPLLGRHSDTPCASCHVEGAGPPTTTCHGCHGNADHHQGRFGRACETCHTAADWRRHTFQHEDRTRYPLRGRHAEVSCTACHDGMLYEEHLDSRCYACHPDDDVHRGQEGTDCQKCHDERGWRREVLFDHDLTRFPLLGAHDRISCADCHTSPAFRDVGRSCIACHAADDVHLGRLGARCGDCHSPVSWQAWDFDHAIRTTFELEGAHTGIACEGCHRERVGEKVTLSARCVDCHEGDDVHRGRFGPLCERCHETTAFRVIRPIQ